MHESGALARLTAFIDLLELPPLPQVASPTSACPSRAAERARLEELSDTALAGTKGLAFRFHAKGWRKPFGGIAKAFATRCNVEAERTTGE